MDLTPNAQELLAFITPQRRVFKWKVMPFGVANAPALFQELMNKILSILRKSHSHVFLGGLDPGQAPLKTLLLMLRLT